MRINNVYRKKSSQFVKKLTTSDGIDLLPKNINVEQNVSAMFALNVTDVLALSNTEAVVVDSNTDSNFDLNNLWADFEIAERYSSGLS